MAMDVFFHALHLIVIALNVVGWMMPPLRLASFICQVATLSCWVGFGLVKGMWGFCPLTYWHWNYLTSLGRIGLPSNYISYISKQWFGMPMNGDFAAGLVLGCFSMALIANILLLRKKL